MMEAGFGSPLPPSSVPEVSQEAALFPRAGLAQLKAVCPSEWRALTAPAQFPSPGRADEAPGGC